MFGSIPTPRSPFFLLPRKRTTKRRILRLRSASALIRSGHALLKRRGGWTRLSRNVGWYQNFVSSRDGSWLNRAPVER